MEEYDAQDAKLAAMFAPLAKPRADAGFSRQVVSRIQRRRWARRASLGAATAAGTAIALGLWNGPAVATAMGSLAAVAGPVAWGECGELSVPNADTRDHCCQWSHGGIASGLGRSASR